MASITLQEESKTTLSARSSFHSKDSALGHESYGMAELNDASFPPTSHRLSTISTATRRRLSIAEREAVELPEVDRGKGAYKFLAAAFVLETMIWGYSFSFGIIQVFLSTHAPFDSASIEAISAVGTISLAIQYILPASIMFVFRRYPDKAKSILWGAMVVSCGSMLLSSWATQVWQLILLQGVLGGTTGAVLYTPVLMWLQDWFVERRGFASGIIFCGTGVGGFIFPNILGRLLDQVGFAWTIRIWALITCITFSGALLVLHPRLPIPKASSRGEFVPMDTSFLRNPTVIIMVLTTFLSSLSFFPVSIYITTYTVALSTPVSANFVLAAYNASSVFGQVGVGWISDRVSYSVIIFVIGMACSFTALLSWGFADTLGKVFGFVVLFGAFSGICSVWNAVSKDVAGTNSQMSSLIFCCFGISRGIASIVGPIIATTLYKQNEAAIGAAWGGYGFKNVQIFVGVMALGSAFGGVALSFARRLRK